MRVLLITWNYPPKVGGMEMMLSRLVQNILPYMDVHVVGPYSDKNESDAPAEKIVRPKYRGLLWFVLAAFFLAIRLLRNHKYDVIIAGSTLIAPIAYFLGRIFKLPVVLNVYGLDLIYPHPLYQGLVKVFLPKCDQFIAISQAAKEEAIKRGAPADRIRILSPGVDFLEFETIPDIDQIRHSYNLDDRLVILSAGRLAKRKGVVEFIKYSLPTIVSKFPHAIFLVVGENPVLSLSHKEDIRTQILTEINRLGLEDHVRLLGRVERVELIKLYYGCDIFVLPAVDIPGDMEGFGIVLIEASAAGKPVVAADIGGIPDAVADGKSGRLVAVENWDELSSAINQLISQPLTRQELGQYGRKRVQTEFDWPVIGRRYVESLADFLGVQP